MKIYLLVATALFTFNVLADAVPSKRQNVHTMPAKAPTTAQKPCGCGR